MASDKQQRPKLYDSNELKTLIGLASQSKNDKDLIVTLTAIDEILENEAELFQIVDNTSIVYFCVTILKEDHSQQTMADSLNLLSSLAQTDKCVNQLLSIHHLPKILLQMADKLLTKLEKPDEQACNLIKKLGGLFYILCLNQKAQIQLQKLGVSQYYFSLLNFIVINFVQKYDEMAIICLVLLEKLSADKIQCQLLLNQKCDNLCLNLIQSYMAEDSQISAETVKLACNLLSTFAIINPQLTENMIQMGALKTLAAIIEQENASTDLIRFAMSAFVEILYANKGKKYENISQILRKFVSPVDDAVDRIINWNKLIITDSESIAIWGTLMRMISSVPRKEEYIREVVLNRKFLKICMDVLSDQKIELTAKNELMQAMNQALCVQNMPRNVLMDEMIKLNAIMPRLKREFASPKNKQGPKASQYQDAVENARLVLEKMGHTDGRDNKKFTMYAMMVIGVCVLIGSGINYLRK